MADYFIQPVGFGFWAVYRSRWFRTTKVFTGREDECRRWMGK